MTKADAIILGGGPGGYAAAIRSAQLGRSVVLLHAAEVADTARNHPRTLSPGNRCDTLHLRSAFQPG